MDALRRKQIIDAINSVSGPTPTNDRELAAFIRAVLLAHPDLTARDLSEVVMGDAVAELERKGLVAKTGRVIDGRPEYVRLDHPSDHH